MSAAPPSTFGEPPMLDAAVKENLYAFAYTMLQADKLVVALKAFRVFVRFAPTDERSWLGLGACHEKLDQLDVAAELYGAGAMVSAPPSARCHLGLARLAEELAVRIEHLERARELAADDDDPSLAALVSTVEAAL